MNQSRICILGSNSHIAKGLIHKFLQGGNIQLHLYTRSQSKVRNFLGDMGESPGNQCIVHEGYRNFRRSSYDVIVNCIGAGTRHRLGGDFSKYFMITEKYDNLVIEYMSAKYPEALYISLSSGAVYGREYSGPAEEDGRNCIRVNYVAPEDYYAIARLNSEAKHRAFEDLRIVDLRIFSYFSRFIDLTDEYFMVEVVNCLLNGKVLVTDDRNIVRDYLHPEDLYAMVWKCMNSGKINKAFDVISSQPVEKKDILDYFSSQYGLRYEVNGPLRHVSPTGFKNIYYSKFNNGASIGYYPAFSSMDAIREEAEHILRGKRLGKGQERS